MTEVTEERDHRMGHPIHLIMKILLCWGHHLVNIHMGHISSWFLPILRGLSTYLFHRPFCHQFSIMFFSMSLTIRPNHWLQPTDQCIITHMAISPCKPSEQPVHCLKFCTGRISLLHNSSGLSQKRAVVLHLSTSRWWLHTLQNTTDFCFLEKDAKRNLVWKGGHWGIAFASLHHSTWKEQVFFRVSWKGWFFVLLWVFVFVFYFFKVHCLS